MSGTMERGTPPVSSRQGGAGARCAAALGIALATAALAACSSGSGGGGLPEGGTTAPPAAAANQPPTVGGTAAKTMPSDETLVSGFTVADPESSPSTLNVSVSSSDTALLGAEGIVLEGSGADRTLRLTPTPDRAGRTTIVVTATDAQGARGNASFTLDVVAVPTSLVALAGEAFAAPAGGAPISLSGKAFVPDSEDPAVFDGLVLAAP